MMLTLAMEAMEAMEATAVKAAVRAVAPAAVTPSLVFRDACRVICRPLLSEKLFRAVVR